MIGDAVDRATDRVGDRITSIAGSYALKAALGVIAFVLLIGVLVCGCIAAFWLLEPEFGAMIALSFVAGGLACLALIFGLSAAAAGRRITLAGTVKPVEVVEEEADEVVDAMGPYKFVASALAAGALLGAAIGGDGRARRTAGATASSLISLLPTVVSAFSVMTAQEATRRSEEVAKHAATSDAATP